MLILGCVVWIFGGGICQTTERCEESCGTDRCGNFLPGPPLSLKWRDFSEIRPTIGLVSLIPQLPVPQVLTVRANGGLLLRMSIRRLRKKISVRSASY